MAAPVHCCLHLKPWAKDLGYDGLPFRFDPERRAMLRAELDAFYAHLYGLNRDELRYIRLFRQLGVRMMHMTYNRRNPLGEGCGAVLELLARLLRALPARAHRLYDLEEAGVMTAAACAEAPCERVALADGRRHADACAARARIVRSGLGDAVGGAALRLFLCTFFFSLPNSPSTASPCLARAFKYSIRRRFVSLHDTKKKCISILLCNTRAI
jgi:hypothetical protein